MRIWVLNFHCVIWYVRIQPRMYASEEWEDVRKILKNYIYQRSNETYGGKTAYIIFWFFCWQILKVSLARSHVRVLFASTSMLKTRSFIKIIRSFWNVTSVLKKNEFCYILAQSEKTNPNFQSLLLKKISLIFPVIFP